MNRAWAFLFLINIVVASGCANLKRPKKAETPPPAPQETQNAPGTGLGAGAAAPVSKTDLASQKAFYEEGLKFYAEEKYLDAKKSWSKVLEINASNDLAAAAQECIRKTDQILKTLQEIETKKEKQGGGTKPASGAPRDEAPVQKPRPSQESISR